MGLIITGNLKEARTNESKGVTYYNLTVEELTYNARGDIIGSQRWQVNALEETYPAIKKLVGQHVILHVEPLVLRNTGDLRFTNATLANIDVLVPA